MSDKDDVIDAEIMTNRSADPAILQYETGVHKTQRPLRVGETVHVHVNHNKGSACHAALITDIGWGGPFAWIFPCGQCTPAPKRMSLMGVKYHRMEECAL